VNRTLESSTSVMGDYLITPALSSSDATFKRPLRADSEFCSQLKKLFWGLTILLGGIQFWISRFAMNTDGISYLDVASAFSRRDWATGVNAYWSPLYPMLLSPALRFGERLPYWEFPLVHFVNFLILIACACAFEFFISRLIVYQTRVLAEGHAEPWAALPEWSLRMLGYTLFLWSALQLTPNSVVSPDLTVALFVYLAAGMVLGVSVGRTRYRDFILLGMILGFGYLAKAPMLPMGLVFVGSAFLAAGGNRKALLRSCVALVGFLIVAGPFISMLSHTQKRFTWGDSWKLNYAWYVDHAPRYHWQGGAPAAGTALHATEKIFAQPPAYAFDRGSATYPVWYDPAYWNQGIRPVFDGKSDLMQIFVNALVYEKIFFHQQAAVLVICIFLFLVGQRGPGAITDIAKYWMLLIPPAAALGMYVLVHVEDRMIAAFDVLLWIAFFSAVRFQGRPETKRAAALAVVSVALLTSLMLGDSILGEMASHSVAELLTWNSPAANFQWQVAKQLEQTGLHSGDKVAWVRPNIFTARQDYSWARLAGLQIIAEVPAGEQDRFWAVSSEQRAKLLRATAQTGAVAFIATQVPDGFSESGWKPLGKTGYWIFSLQDLSVRKL
jgi:hypothetical protein